MIRIEKLNGVYIGYFYDLEITRQSTLLKACEKVSKYVKGRGDIN